MTFFHEGNFNCQENFFSLISPIFCWSYYLLVMDPSRGNPLKRLAHWATKVLPTFGGPKSRGKLKWPSLAKASLKEYLKIMIKIYCSEILFRLFVIHVKLDVA